MNISAAPIQGRTIKFFLRHSVILHCLIIGIFIGIAALMNYSSEKKIKTSMILIQSSVKVDIVAMPKLTIKELRNIRPVNLDFDAKPTEKIKVPPKSDNKNKIEFEKKAKKSLSFMEKMKLLAKKKAKANKRKIKAIKRVKKGVSSKERSELQGLLLAGNKLSIGTSATGSGNAVAGTIYEQYIGQLPSFIKPNWKLPSYLLDKSLQCRIRVFLANSGRLIKAEIFESSGDQEYDAKALAAVKNSSPFPIITKEISLRASRGDIILGFPL